MCPSYHIISSYPVRVDINMCRHRGLLRWHQGSIRMEWQMHFTGAFVNLVLTGHHRIEILLSVKNLDREVVRLRLYTSVLLREYDQVCL